MAASLLPAASDLAQQSWRRVSRLFSASEVEVSVWARGIAHCVGAPSLMVPMQMLSGKFGHFVLLFQAVSPARYPPSQQTNGESPDAAGDAPAAAATAAPPALPAPAGRLELTVDSVTLAGAAASGDVFLVLKCGPHWGRSKVLQLAGG